MTGHLAIQASSSIGHESVTMKSILLGSSSPRRRELLSHLVAESRIQVVPPDDPDELGFEGLDHPSAIIQRVASIANHKLNQVASTQSHRTDWDMILTADTVVIAEGVNSRSTVLGKPDGPNWQETVRTWFRDFYSGKPQVVVTVVCLLRPDGSQRQVIEQTTLLFHPVTDRQIEWYLQTHEPLGKAGGYALQGAGSLFVKSIQGSLSNVVGLPLEPLWDLFREWNVLS